MAETTEFRRGVDAAGRLAAMNGIDLREFLDLSPETEAEIAEMLAKRSAPARDPIGALTKAKEAIGAVAEQVEHAEDCPQDDTCVCPVVALVNEAHREVVDALAARPSGPPSPADDATRGALDPARVLREAARDVIAAHDLCRSKGSFSGFWTHIDDLAKALDAYPLPGAPACVIANEAKPGRCFGCGAEVLPSPCLCGRTHVGVYCWPCHHKNNPRGCAAPFCPEHHPSSSPPSTPAHDTERTP